MKDIGRVLGASKSSSEAATRKAREGLKAVQATGDDFQIAEFVDKNKADLMGADFGKSIIGQVLSKYAENKYTKIANEARKRFNDPTRRRKERSELVARAGSRNDTQVSSLLERSANRRRASKNRGATSAADVLGL